MTDLEIRELAAILVNEHDGAALRIAKQRRNQHQRGTLLFRVWDAIAGAVARFSNSRSPEMPSPHDPD